MANPNINGREINRAMQTLRNKSAQLERAAKIVLRGTAEEIVRTAKQLAPVRSGKLRDSVHLIEENNGASYKIVADAENENGIQYGRYVEYDPRINRPFLYPAIDAQIVPMNQRLKQALENAAGS